MIINYLTIISSILMLLMVVGASKFVLQTDAGTVTGEMPVNTLDFTGTWVTADGYLKYELFGDQTYRETRGKKMNAHTGTYSIHCNQIRYQDNAGFVITGDFQGTDILYQGGHVFYRQ